MADTTNFGWSKPTVGGDNNAWGTELNQLFDDIDTDLKTVSDAQAATQAAVDALEAAASGQVTLYVSSEILQPNNDEDDIVYGSGSGAFLRGDQSKTMFGALPPLPVGATLDEVHLICDKNGNTSVSLDVISVNASTGAVSAVGTTATRSSSGVGAASATGLAHTVGAEFLKVKTSQVGAFQPRFYGIKVVYTPAS